MISLFDSSARCYSSHTHTFTHISKVSARLCSELDFQNRFDYDLFAPVSLSFHPNCTFSDCIFFLPFIICWSENHIFLPLFFVLCVCVFFFLAMNRVLQAIVHVVCRVVRLSSHHHNGNSFNVVRIVSFYGRYSNGFFSLEFETLSRCFLFNNHRRLNLERWKWIFGESTTLVSHE